MGKKTLKALILLFILGIASPLSAQSATSVQYVYDALGRLTTVVDPNGNVATYNYDAVGNLISITNSTSSPSALAITSFAPAVGIVGQTVTIQGQNFSATPGSNTVKFNGTVASVTAATANLLTTTVPPGATTGPISVAVGSSTATSSSNFMVLTNPVVTSVSPTLVPNTPTINFQVDGSNLSGATFSFLPTFTPAAISASNVNINSNGTSATMTLTLASNAVGSFTVVATNGTGSSPANPSAGNTLTILSSDPNADSDGDGLTNIYETAIGSNPANSSTTGDGLPDGWALYFGLSPLSAAAAGQTSANGLTYLQSFQRALNPLIPNLVPPSVANVFPANGATNYPTNGVIVVRFTEPLLAGVSLTAAQNAINTGLPAQSTFTAANASAAAQVLQAYLQRTCCGTTAIPGAVQVLQNGHPVAGSVSLSDDRLSITFAPPQPLSASTTFTVSVQGVRDAAGNLMTQPFQSTFTTGLTATEPTVGSVLTNPPNNATGVDTNAPFRMRFSAPVNPSTLTSQTFFLTDTFTHLTVPGTLQVDAFGFTASFVPAQPYGVGRRFTATLTSGIQNVNGNSFPASSFQFTTGFGPDSQGPTLIGTSPSDGMTSVPLNALVVLEFNDPMDAINALSGLQVQLAGVPVPGAIALSNGNTRITFTPAAALAANSMYTVVTTWQLTDFAENQLSNPDSTTFTTGTASDSTLPTVVSVSPAGGSSGVPTNAIVQLRLNKQIDPLTVTGSTFTVNNGSTFFVPNVVGNITISPDTMTITFTPASPLVPESTYGFGVSGFTDLEGNAVANFSATFTTGLGAAVAPTVVTMSPPNETTGVQANVKVNALMSALVDVESIGNNAITVSSGGTPVAGTISLGSTGTTLTFTPSSLLAVSTVYTVSMSGFTDQAGNAVVPFTSTFTTGASGVADTSAPTVLSVSPTNGATGVAVNSSVVLTFSKNIDPTTVNNSTVPISDSSFTGLLAGSYAVSGAVVTFTPTTVFPGNATIHVAGVNPGPSDLAGNKSNTSSSNFTTAAVADTIAPQVIAVTPNNGATGIGLNPSVVFTFSKSLNPNTVNANTMGLLVNGKKINVLIAHSADNRVVTLSFVGGTALGGVIPGSSTVSVLATSGVTDLSGNALANFESQFATVPASDTALPSVVSQRPVSGAQGVSLTSNVFLYVSGAMNSATIPGAVHISQNGVEITGTTQAADYGQVIQFTPSMPFQNNALIQVFLDSTAQDVDGNGLTSYQGTFATAVNTSTVNPSIVNGNPPSANGVPTNIVMDIGFDQTLNPTTVNTATVSLTQGGTTVVPSTVSLLPGGTVVQIVPTGLLAANTNYTVQMTLGLLGTNGLPDTNDAPGTVLSFTTGAGADTLNPAVLQVSPPNGSVNVGDNANILVLFSKPVNPLTVTASTIQLTGGGTTAVPDSISFTNNNQNVLLLPHAPFPDATQMSLAISGVTDVAGNAVPTQTTHFTTGTGPDTTIPVVVASNPFSNETNVPLNAPVILQINEPVDPGTVNSNTLPIEVQTTGQQVPGNYSVSSDGLTITFVPGAPLAASQGYFASFVNLGITDLVGNRLTNPGGGLSNFVFTTGTTTNTTQPQVVGVSPPNGLTGVPINAEMVIQFNEIIDPLTVNQVTVSSGGSAVNVTSMLTNGNKTLVLLPVMPLNAGTSYTVAVTGVQDISGNSMAASVSSSFMTGTGADLTPPTVVSVSPASGATGVLTSAVIQVQFSNRIDPLTVTSTTFVVYPTSTGQPIAGAIVVSTDGLTATFTPTVALAASTSYSISPTIGIMDLVGQPLSSSVSRFATGTQ